MVDNTYFKGVSHAISWQKIQCYVPHVGGLVNAPTLTTRRSLSLALFVQTTSNSSIEFLEFLIGSGLRTLFLAKTQRFGVNTAENDCGVQADLLQLHSPLIGGMITNGVKQKEDVPCWVCRIRPPRCERRKRVLLATLCGL